MKFKKVLITAGSLAIVTGLLVGCSTTQPVNEPNLSEKGNGEDRENREMQGEVTVRIDAINGNEITASFVEMNRPENTTVPSEKSDKEIDKEMSEPQIEYNVTDETITFTINEETEFKSFGKDEDNFITLDDLKVGDILSVDLDENNNATDVYFSPMNHVESDKDINQQEDN